MSIFTLLPVVKVESSGMVYVYNLEVTPLLLFLTC